jgi:(p)ppGpp synthase/HD superfamily hydrolase
MHLVSPAYGRALVWAEELHRDQRRKGKPVPCIWHLIAVSGLVWEDGGTEDQAIAGLLHDAIVADGFREAVDAGQSHNSIAECFGRPMADIVRDCTDTAEGRTGAEKEPWLVRKTRYVASLEHKSIASLLVMAADKAHNARDMVLDARRDAGMWNKFNAGLDGTAWYFWSLRRLAKLPQGQDSETWAAGYLERPDAHSKG